MNLLFRFLKRFISRPPQLVYKLFCTYENAHPIIANRECQRKEVRRRIRNRRTRIAGVLRGQDEDRYHYRLKPRALCTSLADRIGQRIISSSTSASRYGCRLFQTLCPFPPLRSTLRRASFTLTVRPHSCVTVQCGDGSHAILRVRHLKRPPEIAVRADPSRDTTPLKSGGNWSPASNAEIAGSAVSPTRLNSD